MSTKENIIAKAIEMFNQHGLEYVGIRELAKEMGFKAGNITYYFPTKNDLVTEIATRCTEDNTGILDVNENPGMKEFLFMLKAMFDNQYKYRTLLLSLPHILRNNQEVNRHYRTSHHRRRESYFKILESLYASGYLKDHNEQVKTVFFELMNMFSRFWISDYTICASIGNPKKNRYHHLLALTDFLRLISTPEGIKEIESFKVEIEKAPETA